jgi:hypothetical protein
LDDEATEDELARDAGRLTVGDRRYPVVELFLDQRSTETAQAASTTPPQSCEAHSILPAAAGTAATKHLQAAVDDARSILSNITAQ